MTRYFLKTICLLTFASICFTTTQAISSTVGKSGNEKHQYSLGYSFEDHSRPVQVQAVSSTVGKSGNEKHHYSFEENYRSAEEYFAFEGNPINPRIIEALLPWLSDNGDQILSININGSQKSNRFSSYQRDIEIHGTKKNPKVSITHTEDREFFHFSYEHIGKTPSGIHVLMTADRPGGTGTYMSLLFVRFEKNYGLISDESHSTIKFTQPRLAIKKLGELILGDRWQGTVKLEGNKLTIHTDSIGMDAAENARIKKMKDRVYHIPVESP